MAAASPCVVKLPESFGAKRDGVTDDTKAIREAVNAAVAAGEADGTNYAEVWFSAGTYKLASPTVKGGTTKGNAQVPLPLMSETGPGFTLVLKGMREASPISYFRSTDAARRGAVLHSTIEGAFDGEWGAASIVGGPTPQGLSEAFSNMLIVVDGLVVETPKNPSLLGFDFRKMAEARVPNAAALVAATPKEISEAPPTNELGIGLYMPLAGNGNNARIGNWTCEGWTIGYAFSDHLHADRILTVWTQDAAFLAEPGLHSQGATIEHFACVASTRGLVVQPGGGTFPIKIGFMQVEEVTGDHVHDPENALVGDIAINEGEFGHAPVVTGASRARVIDLNRVPGKVAAPELKSGVATVNPFFRDAFVTIAGATKVEVDGEEQSSLGGVMVPAGKSIKVTGAGLAWAWTLI